VGTLPDDAALTLRRTMVEWEDVDYASYLLAQALGLFPEESFQTQAKWVFDMDNPLSRVLDRILDQLVEARVLEFNDEDGKQYRWRVVGPGYELAAD
jgi:hypothetical protein